MQGEEVMFVKSITSFIFKVVSLKKLEGLKQKISGSTNLQLKCLLYIDVLNIPYELDIVYSFVNFCVLSFYEKKLPTEIKEVQEYSTDELG